MLHVTFLEHSGFLVETESALLLFDYWKGTLPALPEKPLYVFASHRHGDHFNPDIFKLRKDHSVEAFCLGKDIRLTPGKLASYGEDETVLPLCHSFRIHETVSISQLKVTSLHSTDEGVAFLVECDGHTIYHAGDLNWWHWDGEDHGWNHTMEKNFKSYIEPLRDVSIELAMVPIDPRQEQYGYLGADYLLQLARIQTLLPMHQWENFAFTDSFLEAYPQYRSILCPISSNGQVFDF